jgi:DNA polymerase III epsilon subunit-like protein
MEKVATKMRTLGYAASPFLDDLASSDSPGQRLAAITILQVQPNPEKLEWLADRLGIEQPFIGYHAAVALLTAARVHDREQTDQLRSAIQTAKQRLGESRRGTDRDRVLDDALKELDEC